MPQIAAVIPMDWMSKLKSLPWPGVKLRISTVAGNETMSPPRRGVGLAIIDPNIMTRITFGGAD